MEGGLPLPLFLGGDTLEFTPCKKISILKKKHKGYFPWRLSKATNKITALPRFANKKFTFESSK